MKWAGGKSQLISTFELHAYFPKEIRAYIEPFVGGGSVFLYLYKSDRIRRATLSDYNKDLINCYVAVRRSLEELISELGRLQKCATDETFYYNSARRRFNEIKLETGEEGDVEKAALLVYLNKTCFNGLYRVNRKGEFNVPWGGYRNPHIYDEDNLRNMSKILNAIGITIRCCSYGKALKMVQTSDFVYLDPPYQPVSSTSSFTAYTPNAFKLSDQESLARTYQALSNKGCNLMMSNAPTVRHLYEGHGYRIETVRAARAISSVGTKRGPIDELVIMNY